MFDIEKLLSLFPNEKIRDLLEYSYYFSQTQNKKMSDNVFEHLLLLKKQKPWIDIIFDPTIEYSFFGPNENIVYINSLSMGTMFHEITHLLSCNCSEFQIPSKYYLFEIDFLSNPNNTDSIITFLSLCRVKKTEFFRNIETEGGRDNRTLDEDLDILRNFQANQYTLICMLEDIVDSIYSGQSFSNGIHNVKDNNSFTNNSKKTAGHGCEYFFDISFRFEEILANYQAIKLIDPDNELFILLKNILGPELITLLDQRCCEICGQIFKKTNTDNMIKIVA